jgi:hypothetical protein
VRLDQRPPLSIASTGGGLYRGATPAASRLVVCTASAAGWGLRLVLTTLSCGDLFAGPDAKRHAPQKHTRMNTHNTPLSRAPPPQASPAAPPHPPAMTDRNGSTRVVHKLQYHPLSRSASRGGPHRNRSHAAPCAALTHTPNRSWHSAAPSSPSSHDCGAAGIAARLHRWHVACSGRSWSRCSRSSAAPTSRSPVPTPVPTPTLRSTSAASPSAPTHRTVEGTHAAQHAPDAASASCSAGLHAPRTRPTAPCPAAATSTGARREPGALTSARAWARWARCWWRRCLRRMRWRARRWSAGEEVGEARAESLLGDVGEAVVGVVSASQVWARQVVAWRTATAC